MAAQARCVGDRLTVSGFLRGFDDKIVSREGAKNAKELEMRDLEELARLAVDCGLKFGGQRPK
jgi:hypothetical protein